MVFVETATQNHPARLIAALRNANPFENTFRLDWTPPFGRLISDHPRPPDQRFSTHGITYRDTLAFVPTANHELIDNPPSVELSEDGTWRHGGNPARGFPDRIRLEPKDVVFGEYYIAGHPEGEGNGRPTGVYEFSRAQEGSIRIVAWNTQAPGPEQHSLFEGVTLPPIPNREDIAWYHEATPDSLTYVRPSIERTDFPAAIDFTFINHSMKVTGCGHWNLYKLVDGQWYHLGPFISTAVCRQLLPGGAETWTLHAYHGEGLDTLEVNTFDFLGGGRYAAVAGYGHETDFSGALTEFVGDGVTIVPTDDVMSERSGNVVTVTGPGWKDEEPPDSAKLIVTRAQGAERTIIVEQVMRERFKGLRNTIPFFEAGVDKVVFRTTERVAETARGYEAALSRFRIPSLNQSYQSEIERLGSP